MNKYFISLFQRISLSIIIGGLIYFISHFFIQYYLSHFVGCYRDELGVDCSSIVFDAIIYSLAIGLYSIFLFFLVSLKNQLKIIFSLVFVLAILAVRNSI